MIMNMKRREIKIEPRIDKIKSQRLHPQSRV